MPSNFEQFSKDVQVEGARLVRDSVVRAQKFYTLEAIRRVVDRMPRDTGETASRWHVTIGAPTASEVAGAGGGTDSQVSAAAAALAALGPFVVTYVVNPSTAAVVLEYGLFDPPNPGPSKDPRPGRKGRVLVQGGYSTQAPQGMVAVTLQELRALPPPTSP